jgi:hyperosmotically inducible periplasmic protein
MRFLLGLIIGIALGAYGMYSYQTRPEAVAQASHAAGNTSDQMVAKGREIAANVSDSIAAKMQEWHLTGPEVRADLAKTGEVVRQNTARARERVADVRIAAVIKAKFVLDRDLSAGAITVDSRDGDVTLSGTVASEDLVGRAVADALDTEGVHHVAAKLTVKP